MDFCSEACTYVQPSNEQFSNILGLAWLRCDKRRWIFVEDEGPNVGMCYVPQAFFVNVIRRCTVVLDL